MPRKPLIFSSKPTASKYPKATVCLHKDCDRLMAFYDFTTSIQDQIDRIMDKLNNRLRKCLGMKTPNQVFFGISPPVAPVS